MVVNEPIGQNAAGQPSEEDIRKYLEQLRSVPAEQVVADVLFGFANAAQAKLGRRDARLLIDLTATVLEQTRRYLSNELVGQLDQILGQLRLSQVQAESRVAAGGQTEPNDLAEAPPPPSATAPAPGIQQPTSQPPTAKPKLWVPGRDF